MESSRIVGGDEEYSSCESGWTMYLEDAYGNEQSDVVDDDFLHVKDDKGNDDDDGGDDESDDSMASDASSGPSNHLPRGNTKHAAAKNSSKQVHHQQHGQRTERANKSSKTDEKEESLLNAGARTTAASRVRSRGKVSITK